ncbi:MAG: cysteine--tRNA ligase, partial [Acidilobaceae archaeon]
HDMSDDFNFGSAMRWLWELTNIYYRELEASESQALLLYTYRVLSEFNKVYAVLDDIIEAPKALGVEDKLLELIVQVRGELRARKMYDLSDHIRDRLSKLGIKLLDYKDRTEWVKEG